MAKLTSRKRENTHANTNRRRLVQGPEVLATRKGREPRVEPVADGSSQINDAQWIATVRKELAAWYSLNGRVLPWRQELTPYRVLVSEMMLVQTTVSAVIPYFERFLKQFPTPRSLAEASEDDVLKAWEGLGYYRRARQLQAAARIMMGWPTENHHPDSQEIQKLPGVGKYIAGAILSFAYDRPAPVLEANSQRVLSRLLAARGELKSTSTQSILWNAAARLVPETGSGDFNQAIMDLGATICVPRDPQCLICPLARLCRAKSLGIQDQLPTMAPKPPPLVVEEACALVVKEGRLLLLQRAEGGLWSRFWEFPTTNLSGADPAGRNQDGKVELEKRIEQLTGIRGNLGPVVRTLKYSVTKHRVTLQAHVAQGLGGDLRPASGFADVRWVAPSDLGNLSLISPARKLATWILQNPEQWQASAGV